MQDTTTIDIIYGNFDYMTIFPPSKIKYFSPWVINNCCILINKWNFKEIYCNNIETIPRINDPNYRFVVIPFLENKILPSSLPHIKQIEEEPKFTFFQKIHRKYFFSKEQKERELSDFTEQYGNSFLSNFRNLRAISPYVEGWNESPHAINYLSCNYEIVHKTTEEKEFSHFGNEGFLKLDSFVTDMIKPNRNILDGLALKKMKTYLPDKLGGFLTFHLENCPYPTYYFIEMITDYSEILYFNSETSQNINCQLAFKEWLNNTVKSKKLNCQKFSELVKSKLTIETSHQAEGNTTGVQPPQRKNKAVTGFNSRLTNEKLKQLCIELKSNDFLCTNTNDEKFVNAFNGEDLKDFERMKWIDKTPKNNAEFNTQTLLEFLYLLRMEEDYYDTLPSNQDNFYRIIERIFEGIKNIQPKNKKCIQGITPRQKLLQTILQTL